MNGLISFTNKNQIKPNQKVRGEPEQLKPLQHTKIPHSWYFFYAI